MSDSADRALAIVGLSAILPDAPDVQTFWSNLEAGRYSIGDVPRERWDPELYYDADPSVPGKTYSRIGGFVREWDWDPMGWHLPVPPKVADAMDEAQRWAIACARTLLQGYGHPERPLDLDRTAVVVGTAMAGDLHYWSSLPVFFPEYARALAEAPSFAGLPDPVRAAIENEMHERVNARFPGISEDSMPGELANCIAGRIANLFDFHGPNFICDAACASALAAIDAAREGLITGEYDAALVGGVDRNMGPAPFVKFCKIGALSATGTRPYGDGADGFVMGEGAAFFLLKRLADAEAAGDTVYAVLRGVGGASDGRGKGITAPNPAGQRLAIQRAWADAELSPASVNLVEGHGTSTRVGDVVEVQALSEVLGGAGARVGSIPLGSVKSNIGHLKGAAGAAGLLKVIGSLHHKQLYPSLNAEKPNPNIDFGSSPLYVNTELKPWDAPPDGVRRAGVSAFGFGGTNYHAVLEEFVPGRLTSKGTSVQVTSDLSGTSSVVELKSPPRGAAVLGTADEGGLRAALEKLRDEASAGRTPPIAAPDAATLRASQRIALDYADAEDLAAKAERALRALAAPAETRPAMERALRAQGVFTGSGEPGKVAFLYTGQGSQYANMLADLRSREPVVAATFDEADRVLEPLLGRPLSEILFVDADDEDAVKAAEAELRKTEITQPAVLTVDTALTRLLAEYGIVPDVVMGHSLGEYGALVAAGALPFADALEAVSARGREMASLTVEDNGLMAAVFAPLERIEAVLAEVPGNVVVANINSTSQAVIGGATEAVERAMEALRGEGHDVVQIPVSHAFHTSIVSPASDPLRATLERLRLAPPAIPLVGNVHGELYPMGPGVEAEMIDLLARQVASPVQFVKGLGTLYELGARTFVEVGPKRALHGFAEDVLGGRDDVLALFTNHPKTGGLASFNQALCGLWASGIGVREAATPEPARPAPVAERPVPAAVPAFPAVRGPAASGDFGALGDLFVEFLERGAALMGRTPSRPDGAAPVVSGAALGLPGRERVFDDRNVQRILDGEQEIDLIPTRFRQAMIDKHITRLVKGGGEPHFEAIEDSSDVIKLAARSGALDLCEEFGVPAERDAAFDVSTRLAIGAGLEALRDAGIPLAMHYRDTTTGTRLPDRWMLPDALRDETGVIFASAFPGFDAFADELTRFHADHGREIEIDLLRGLLGRAREMGGSEALAAEIEHRLHELETEHAENAYEFDRRFLFRVLPMAHAQFAEYIGARGPNTHINSACASTTQAFALAQDWIAAGRCRRVVVVAADDATSEHLLEWIGSGFLATGAAATDDVVEKAALPFDRRRHGMILGMGAAGAVIEAPGCVRERGLRPICELLSAVTANSAFHGTRLDVSHIAGVMERLVADAERRFGLDRRQLARELVFVSHETYTPARGGSASAEVEALRRVFGDLAAEIVVANTKGLTGHPMGVGIEDAVAIKALETGVIPPVPNFAEPDPDLGTLHLSKGGRYPVRYALRLGAGFGSQISMTLLRWCPSADGTRPEPDALGYETRLEDAARYRQWLTAVSGHAEPEIEVVSRTLRLRDAGAPLRAPAPAPAPAVVERAPAQAPVEPAPVPAPPEPVAAPAAATNDVEAEAQARVLAIVSEKTGYPAEMLELDLDLEADLGIDTVKQAETFAAIREAYDIPRDENLKLRDYPTLAHAVRFVMERRPDRGAGAAGEAPQAAADTATTEPAPRGHGLARGDDAAARATRRRVPVPGLRAAADRCKPSGVVLEAGTRVAILPDAGGVAPVLERRLRARGVDVVLLDPAAADPVEALRSAVEQAPVQGLYWLPALDAAPALGDLDLAGWRAALDLRVKRLFDAAGEFYDGLEAPGGFLVAGTRMGGRLGLDDGGAACPLGGAVSGFVKALGRERPAALVKVVDFARSRRTAEPADALIEETLCDPGAVEIGRADGRRYTVGLLERPAQEEGGLDLVSDSVFLVSGAAGSIVSAITADLARGAGGGVFHLLDLAPAPTEDDADVRRFAEDPDALRKEIFERLKQAGERATPVRVERELADVERRHAAASLLAEVRAAGGETHWHPVDLTDADAVAGVVGDIRSRHERIDVLLHAAGFERSRPIPEKARQEFDLVFDVKADGWFNLLSALGDAPLGATVAFSSIAGRFGNAGQTDYSAANDLLAKQSTRLAADRPGLRALTLDWTAWAEIGMASRGSIPEIMGRAGIDMLAPAAGIPIVRQELMDAGRTGEVLIAGALGVLEAERDPDGGLRPGDAPEGEGVVAPRWTAMSLADGLCGEARLDPARQPFLDHHRIDGTPVLPGVMGLEAFGELAGSFAPETPVAAIEDVEFLAPFKFYRDEPRALEPRARLREARDGSEGWVADCRLIGSRELAGRGETQVTEHFRARLRLGKRPAGENVDAPSVPSDGGAGRDDVYRVYFHGPAYQLLDRVWSDGQGRVVGRLATERPADREPADAPLATRPLLLELCFQTAGVAEIARTGRLGLPSRIERVELPDVDAPEGDVFAVVEECDGVYDARVVDARGRTLLEMTGYATMALPQDLPEELRGPLAAALHGGGE
ncbi:MAG: SDR family oxidoreductase [Myxococcota bacterium]